MLPPVLHCCLGLPEIECGTEEVYSFVEYVLDVYYAKVLYVKVWTYVTRLYDCLRCCCSQLGCMYCIQLVCNMFTSSSVL